MEFDRGKWVATVTMPEEERLVSVAFALRGMMRRARAQGKDQITISADPRSGMCKAFEEALEPFEGVRRTTSRNGDSQP